MKKRNMIVIIILIAPVSAAALALMALAAAWLWSERRRSQHGKESVKMDDNSVNKDQVEPVSQPEDLVSKEEDEEVASVVVSGGQSEEGDIFAQALKVVQQAEAKHGALKAEPRRVDPTRMIRELLVQCYGEQWESASFAHYHAFNGNCIFVAMAVASHSDTEATLHCRVVEVDPEGHFIFPNPVKVEDVQNE